MTGSAAHGSATGHSSLRAPARTRLPGPQASAPTELTLLPPVLSGLFETSRPQSFLPDAIAEPVAFENVTAEPSAMVHSGLDDALPLLPDDEPAETFESVVDWFGEDDVAPWEQAEPEESTELMLDAPVDGVDPVLDSGDVVEAPDGLDSVAASGHEESAEASPARPARTPLSPWDLGAASADDEAAGHAARARAEWDALGEALTGSLSVESPATQPRGAHEIELTDEIVASLEGQLGESYSPFRNLNPPDPFDALSMYAGKPGTGDRRAALSDLARRLEAFAAQIRAEGPEALARAQREGDRVDALLAGIAAGFIAGRDK